MKRLSTFNLGNDVFSSVRKISLWNYALGIGFSSNKLDKLKTITLIIERRYLVDGIPHLKRKGYAIQHKVCGKNNRISVHKRTQILKGM